MYTCMVNRYGLKYRHVEYWIEVDTTDLIDVVSAECNQELWTELQLEKNTWALDQMSVSTTSEGKRRVLLLALLFRTWCYFYNGWAVWCVYVRGVTNISRNFFGDTFLTDLHSWFPQLLLSLLYSRTTWRKTCFLEDNYRDPNEHWPWSKSKRRERCHCYLVFKHSKADTRQSSQVFAIVRKRGQFRW